LNIFLKRVYIRRSTNNGRGGILVKPEDFINKKWNNNVDRAILDELHTLRNCSPFSAREIASLLRHQYICKNFHIFALPAGVKQVCPICHQEARQLLNENVDYAERTVRNRLLSLHAQGDLQKMAREPTGEQGRAPEVYHLSGTFLTMLEDYLNKKEMKLGLLANATIRCNDPMQCPDQKCKICANAGIKTCWD
jgi:hypothetical protein